MDMDLAALKQAVGRHAAPEGIVHETGQEFLGRQLRTLGDLVRAQLRDAIPLVFADDPLMHPRTELSGGRHEARVDRVHKEAPNGGRSQGNAAVPIAGSIDMDLRTIASVSPQPSDRGQVSASR